MKKIGFVSAFFAGVLILLIITAAVVSDEKRREKQEIELVRQEVNEQIKRNMKKAVKEGTFSDYLEPSQVSFVVKDVWKEDVVRYAVKIIFIAKTDGKLNEIQMKEAAGDMASLFREFTTDWGKRVTASSRGRNGGIVTVINGKVIGQKEEDVKDAKVREKGRMVIRRRGCERVIIFIENIPEK